MVYHGVLMLMMVGNATAFLSTDDRLAREEFAGSEVDEIGKQWQRHVSSVQNPCWLMLIRDYTTQYIGDYNNPIQ